MYPVIGCADLTALNTIITVLRITNAMLTFALRRTAAVEMDIGIFLRRPNGGRTVDNIISQAVD